MIGAPCPRWYATEREHRTRPTTRVPTCAETGWQSATIAVLIPTIVPVDDVAPHIGTLRGKPLHASLKQWYSRPGDHIEVPVDRFVIDLVRDDLLIEVQTRGFSSMKQKLANLLDHGHHVRIVHPIPLNRWIVKADADGRVISRRRSPRHGDPTDLFAELVSFPDLVTHAGLEIHLILTHEEEYRHHTPNRSWRRRGWTVMERRLIDVVDTLMISGPEDLADLLPADLPQPFSTRDLATSLGRSRRVAQQMAYCLRRAGVIAPVDKVGNAVRYRID